MTFLRKEHNGSERRFTKQTIGSQRLAVKAVIIESSVVDNTQRLNSFKLRLEFDATKQTHHQ